MPPTNLRQTKHRLERCLGMEDRFSLNCRKEAEECRREAERAVSPLDREAWLRLAEEWNKLAEGVQPARGLRRF